ncbi:hypothetical protein TNCV_2942721 [Trichonephila clavipes]|nr:hypothetical protein TNCV_2942721 [Trichonephila clavipes]
MDAADTTADIPLDFILLYTKKFCTGFEKIQTYKKYLSRPSDIVVSYAVGQHGMDVYKCTVPLRHGVTLNSRRIESPLVKLGEGKRCERPLTTPRLFSLKIHKQVPGTTPELTTLHQRENLDQWSSNFFNSRNPRPLEVEGALEEPLELEGALVELLELEGALVEPLELEGAFVEPLELENVSVGEHHTFPTHTSKNIFQNNI